jgi:hypothetical protein
VSEVAVFREELQSGRLVLKVNGPSGIGRQATGEDTVRRLGKCLVNIVNRKVYIL